MNFVFKSRIPVVLFFAMFFSPTSSQNIVHQFGKASECKIDSNTVQVFLPSGTKNEGLFFIVNLDGKTCSSGKVNDLEGFNHMKNELIVLNQESNITKEVYDRVLCSLEKSERIKILILDKPDRVDQLVINDILNSSCE